MNAHSHPHSSKYSFDPAAIFSMIERNISQFDKASYPPYNIVQTSEDAYEIELAVAGFADEQIEITVEKRQLTIEAKPAEGGEERTFLHRGIAQRAFRRTFALAEYMEVGEAELTNGLLRIKVTREVPEAARKKTVNIRRA
jgi:molecular chaperone IbpA